MKSLRKHLKTLGLLASVLIFFIAPLNAQAATPDAAPGGKFILKFDPPKNKKYNSVYTLMKNDKRLKAAIHTLNKAFTLPKDISIVFTSDRGMFFNSKTNKIVVGYFSIYDDMKLYKKDNPGDDPEEIEQFTKNSTLYMLYHEVGHALMYAYDIPIPSNRETAVDYLANILVESYEKNAFDIIRDGVFTFEVWGLRSDENETRRKKTAIEDADLWGEHAYNWKRYYHTICLAYGRYPKQTQKQIVRNHKDLQKFIQVDGSRCKELYNRIYREWMQLLLPHMDMIP